MTSEHPDKPAPSSAVPVTDNQQATPQPKNNSPLDGWVQDMVQTQIELSKDPIRHYHASRRGF